MRTLAVRNGDLVLTGSKFGMVEGIARVQQQLGLAMREAFGSDRFHRSWGSTLPTWIGQVLTPNVPFEIRAEVTRIVRDFIIQQNEKIKERAALGYTAVVSAEEMIMEIRDIKIETRYDTILVKVTLRTASGQEFSVLTTPGSVT
jgi:hypothetical protein